MHNEILEHLYNVEGHTNNDILAYLMDKFPDSNKANVLYAQETIINLVKNNLITLTNGDYLEMYKYWSFKNMQDGIGKTISTGLIGRITFEGKNYIDNLRRNRKQDESFLEQAKSIRDTNDSIQTLNRRTGWFYKKQRTYNTTQKGLTIAILFSSLVYTAVTVVSYMLPQTKTPEQPRLEKIEKELESLKKTLEKTVIVPPIGANDSLSKPIKEVNLTYGKSKKSSKKTH